MSKKLKNVSKIKFPKSHKELSEFGKMKKGIAICKTCGAFLYLKSWHHTIDRYIRTREWARMPVRFVLCPACWMAKYKQYEGKLIIEHIPPKKSVGLFQLIHSYSNRAYQRDPEDRLIDIKRHADSAEFFFTENQLATRLAKKIKSVFKVVHVTIKYAKHSQDAALIVLRFD